VAGYPLPDRSRVRTQTNCDTLVLQVGVGCGDKDPTSQNQPNVKEPVGNTNQTDFPE